MTKMIKPSFLSSAFCAVATSTTLFGLGIGAAPAVAVSLFNFSFDGTLIGPDPLGTAVTSQEVKGNFVLDADIANNSPTPIAGRYDAAIKDLNLTFTNTPAVTFSAADFPGGTNRIFIGAIGKQEEFQFLFGNVAAKAPFFQPPSLGIIFTSSNLTPTSSLKEVLTPSIGTFDGQFKLALSPDQVSSPNNLFSGSITITPVPEPNNTFGVILLSLGLMCLAKFPFNRSFGSKDKRVLDAIDLN